MWEKFKEKIIQLFLLDVYNKRVEELNAFEVRLIAWEKDQKLYEKKVNITDLVREQLEGFNPRLIDDTGIMIMPTSSGNANGPEVSLNVNIFDDAKKIGLGEDDLLTNAKRLSEDKFLNFICTYLIRNQIIWSFRRGNSLDELNFGRASVNGVELVLDQIKTLTGIFIERNTPEPKDFDKHEAL